MIKKELMIIQLILSLLMTFQPNIAKANNTNCVLVKGWAKVVIGNQMPISRTLLMPLKDKLIIAVLGHVETIEGRPSIPLNSISARIIETRTDENGLFRFLLSPGYYTFFIVNKNQAYLNRFDGNGFFKGTEVTTTPEELLVTDDRNLLY